MANAIAGNSVSGPTVRSFRELALRSRQPMWGARPPSRLYLQFSVIFWLAFFTFFFFALYEPQPRVPSSEDLNLLVEKEKPTLIAASKLTENAKLPWPDSEEVVDESVEIPIRTFENWTAADLWADIHRLSNEWMKLVESPPLKPKFGKLHLDIEKMWVTVRTAPSPWNPRVPCFDIEETLEMADRSNLVREAVKLVGYLELEGKPNPLNMSRRPTWRPEQTFYEDWEWRTFACLPANYLTGTAKSATTAFYTLLAQHPDVPNLGKKEQEFWNRAIPREQKWLLELSKYGRRYGFHTWEWQNSVPVDTSPLYWRRPDVHRQILTLVPHARNVIFMRDPVNRTLSCYKYFCLQEREPKAGCNTEEFERRVVQAIARARHCACTQLNPAPDQCNTYILPTLLPVANRTHLREPFAIENSSLFYQDPWPMDDPEVMDRAHHTCWWDNDAESVYQCGFLEGMFWRELRETMLFWDPRSVKLVMNDDFQQDPIGTTKQLAKFYGLRDWDGYQIPPDGKGLNTGRRSKGAELRPPVRALIERIMTPHLIEHIRLLTEYVDSAQISSVP